jgi:hypothetical protein
MSGAYSREGATENDYILHILRCKAIGCLLEVTCSEEMKDGAEGLLHEVKHGSCRTEDLEVWSRERGL